MSEPSTTAAVLAYLNDVLQAIIVIFGAAVVLYNLPRLKRGAVIRSFTALVFFVIVVYLTELLVSRTLSPSEANFYLRLGWMGIALVPAAQFHLSDALLTTTGKFSSRRRRLVIGGYVVAAAFASLGAFTNWIVESPTSASPAPRLMPGPYLWAFGIFFWLVIVSSIYNVWRARSRCLTSATRKRMTTTLVAILAAPLGVFPYTLFAADPTLDFPVFLWPVVILVNLAVSILFAALTSQLVYFGAASPERVVRTRLYKYMARVPMAATIVLLVYVLVSRAPTYFGLDKNVALGFAVVATLMLVEWFVHAYKRPLERILRLDDDPDVKRIQTLSERLLTTAELREFLESVLAATVEALRTPTAFVASLTSSGSTLEAAVGSLAPQGPLPDVADWRQLTQQVDYADGDSTDELMTDPRQVNGFFVWQDYWIQPLYSESGEQMLGILGIRARGSVPDLSADELAVFYRLKDEAAGALEDRFLQQGVFAAIEGLLPEITALQERRRAATFGGLPALTAAGPAGESALLQDPEFNSMVRDALTHYWGGPKLTESPLLQLQVVQRELEVHDNNPVNALRAILVQAIEQQRPDGQRSLSTTEWILYNILDLKFIQGRRVRDVARRLAMSESDLYRKQRVAIENVARTIGQMERDALDEIEEPLDEPDPIPAESALTR